MTTKRPARLSDFAGILTEQQAHELEQNIKELRRQSRIRDKRLEKLLTAKT